MADEDIMLEFEKNLFQPDEYKKEEVYQVEDGKIFYFETTYGAEVLRIKWRREIFQLSMREAIEGYGIGRFRIYGMGACGNELFFVYRDKIYKAVFACPKIIVSFVRDKLESEKVQDNACCTRTYDDGRKFVYRLNQDPDTAGFETTFCSNLYQYPGGNILISEKGSDSWNHNFWINKTGDNFFEFRYESLGNCVSSYAQNDNSSHVYVTNGKRLALIRNGEIEPLTYSGIYNIRRIIGVHNGLITVDHQGELWTARLKDIESPRSLTDLIKDIHREMRKEVEKLRTELKDAIDANCTQMADVEDAVEMFKEAMVKRMDKMNETLEKMSLHGKPST